jgi:hypothetical protein
MRQQRKHLLRRLLLQLLSAGTQSSGCIFSKPCLRQFAAAAAGLLLSCLARCCFLLTASSLGRSKLQRAATYQVPQLLLRQLQRSRQQLSAQQLLQCALIRGQRLLDSCQLCLQLPNLHLCLGRSSGTRGDAFSRHLKLLWLLLLPSRWGGPNHCTAAAAGLLLGSRPMLLFWGASHTFLRT